MIKMRLYSYKIIHSNEFSKYKNDVRKTWDKFKEIIDKKAFKSDFRHVSFMMALG